MFDPLLGFPLAGRQQVTRIFQLLSHQFELLVHQSRQFSHLALDLFSQVLLQLLQCLLLLFQPFPQLLTLLLALSSRGFYCVGHFSEDVQVFLLVEFLPF
jgi:hypothetical protein